MGTYYWIFIAEFSGEGDHKKIGTGRCPTVQGLEGTDRSGVHQTMGKCVSAKVSFYDEVDSDPNTPTGEYSETYRLTEEGSTTRLSIEAGPLERVDISLHSPLWEKALMKMKALGEE